MSVKGFTDWFLGRSAIVQPPEVPEGTHEAAVKDDLRFDRKRLDEGVGNLVASADQVVQASTGIKNAVEALVKELNKSEKKNAKTSARAPKT